MVSAYTNFYAPARGSGEIPSEGTARASGSFFSANVPDAGGLASVTADLATGGIRSAATAVPLASGTYPTYASGTTWPWRSAATVIDTGLADGDRTFTVTATDKVGNPPKTSPAQAVEVDDTPFSATTASCANAGNADNLLAAGDATDFGLGDTIFPGSVRAGWNGTALTATAILRNGTLDHFDLNTDFGLTLFQGTVNTQAWNLNTGSWVSVNADYPASVFSLSTRTTLRLAYHGGSVTVRGSTADANLGTAARDAAGNAIAAAFTESCSTAPW